MRKFHKGLLVGGVALAVLVPAGMVAADQGDGQGRGPANATRDCTGDQAQDRIQARDGTGPRHAEITTGTATATNGNQHQSGQMDGSGPRADRPLDGTGNQWGSGR